MVPRIVKPQGEVVTGGGDRAGGRMLISRWHGSGSATSSAPGGRRLGLVRPGCGGCRWRGERDRSLRGRRSPRRDSPAAGRAEVPADRLPAPDRARCRSGWRGLHSQARDSPGVSRRSPRSLRHPPRPRGPRGGRSELLQGRCRHSSAGSISGVRSPPSCMTRARIRLPRVGRAVAYPAPVLGFMRFAEPRPRVRLNRGPQPSKGAPPDGR